jgi:mannose-6-phosphate isomerase-like protein (cupin superfamily)
MTTFTTEAGIVRAGEGTVLIDGPVGAVLLAGAGQTGGGVSLVMHPLAPRALGSPVHTHRDEDEWSYVLEGEIGVQLGDQVLTARPGDLVLKPRGVPHAFWNATDAPARFLEIITPSGFEHYFAGVGALFADGSPDLAALGELAERHGLHMDLASVPRLAAAHGLRLDA